VRPNSGQGTSRSTLQVLDPGSGGSSSYPSPLACLQQPVALPVQVAFPLPAQLPVDSFPGKDDIAALQVQEDGDCFQDTIRTRLFGDEETEMRRRDFADEDSDSVGYDDEQPGPLESAASVACTRGLNGVTGLSMSHAKLKEALAQSTRLGEDARLGETHSSPNAVRGAHRKWVRGDALGRGSLGVVFQAMDQTSGEIFAVKAIAINPGDALDMKFKSDLENEVNICSALSHPSIVTYGGHDYMDCCLYIYLEYCVGGCMASMLRQFGVFEDNLIQTYTRDLLQGLQYLHSRSPPVVHRDIKGANVLMAQDASGPDLRAKLSDFGCSKRTHDTLSHTLKGSIPWMAPEVIGGAGYGRKADIWSFGCVMVEMGSAKSPWGRFDNPMAAMCKISMGTATPPLPEQLSDECKDFISRCLRRDPKARPHAIDLLEHNFIRDLVR